jgi:hypothetical protein
MAKSEDKPLELNEAETMLVTTLEGLFGDPNSDALVTVSASHFQVLQKIAPGFEEEDDVRAGGKLVMASKVCSVLHPTRKRTPDENADKPVKMPANKPPKVVEDK